jgi:heme-degrading monooxygenase HmoA
VAALALMTAASLAFAAEPAVGSRFTFSWPVGPDAPAPRGGTTQGPALQVLKSPSPAWQQLQAPGLAAFERDRRAILAMAGSYRVAFDFLEVASFVGDGARPRPYQSWGTEKVYVDEDAGRTIRLVHILEMRIVDKDGKVAEPVVTKHWRQDWRYEPASIVEAQGNESWRRRDLDRATARGAWSQTVYQVDESPRYASVGRWEHNAAFSTWISADTARPLPRREWSVRKDYDFLWGTNRHTIVPTGWIQEENNLKAAGRPGEPRAGAGPYVGR